MADEVRLWRFKVIGRRPGPWHEEPPHPDDVNAIEWFIARPVAADEAMELILRGIDDERRRYLARGERDAAELVATMRDRDEWRARAERAEAATREADARANTATVACDLMRARAEKAEAECAELRARLDAARGGES